MSNGTPAVANSLAVPLLKNLNITLPYEPAIPLLDIYSDKLETDLQINLVINARWNIIHNSKKEETTQITIKDEWIKEKNMRGTWVAQ